MNFIYSALSSLSILIYPGIIIFLIKSYHDETRKVKVFSSGDAQIYKDYVSLINKKIYRIPFRSLYFGSALLLVGIIFMAFSVFQFESLVNNLAKYQVKDHQYKQFYHSYTINFINSLKFAYIIIPAGISLIIYYLISKKTLNKLTRLENENLIGRI